MTEENNKLKNENKNFVNGIKQVQPDDFNPNTDLSNPNSVADELKRVQRKNASLKRENEIIRRELASFKGKTIGGKFFKGFF